MIIRALGQVPYEPTLLRMQQFTTARTSDTLDEIWWLEHPSVFTLGMAADRSHLLAPGNIPVVQADRGGQVTYHGPGQLVVYPLVDIRRLGLAVRDWVQLLENAVIAMLAAQGISAAGRRDAPGVYVEGRKLASIGMRIKKGASYHGLALNVNLDLEPFKRINPCGMAQLEVTQLAKLGIGWTVAETAAKLVPYIETPLQLTTPSTRPQSVSEPETAL